MAALYEVYQELADREERRGAAQNRDRFLILAADAALADGAAGHAEELRARLLQHNPHHLLRPYPSLADALRSPDVLSYVADLRDTYPPEEAARLLESLRGADPVPAAPPDPLAPPALDEQTVDETPAPTAAEPERPEPETPEPEIYPLRGADPTPPSASAAPGPPRGAAGEVFPLPSRKHLPAERPEFSTVSAWVSTILSALLLGAAVGLGVYTFGRPFLQR